MVDKGREGIEEGWGVCCLYSLYSATVSGSDYTSAFYGLDGVKWLDLYLKDDDPLTEVFWVLSISPTEIAPEHYHQMDMAILAIYQCKGAGIHWKRVGWTWSYTRL